MIPGIIRSYLYWSVHLIVSKWLQIGDNEWIGGGLIATDWSLFHRDGEEIEIRWITGGGESVGLRIEQSHAHWSFTFNHPDLIDESFWRWWKVLEIQHYHALIGEIVNRAAGADIWIRNAHGNFWDRAGPSIRFEHCAS